MELDETMLRERLDTAVADLTPDTVSLVTAGQRSGEGLRRRRRWQAGGSALAVAAMVGGAFYISGDLLEHRATGPTDPSPTTSQQLVSASPRGMAAAVSDSVDLGTPIAVAGQVQTEGTGNGHSLQVGLGYVVDGQKVELDAAALADLTLWKDTRNCAGAGSPAEQRLACDETPLDDGTPAFRVLMKYDEPGVSGSPRTDYIAVAAVRRDDQLVVVSESLRSTGARPDYTFETLPVPMSVLLRVAVDPVVGLSTTSALNADGKAIQNFKDSLIQSQSSSSGQSSVSVVTAPPPAPTSK